MLSPLPIQRHPKSGDVPRQRCRPGTRFVILENSNRVFLATPFRALEVIPKAAFNRQRLELLLYERYMTSATTYRGLNRIEKMPVRRRRDADWPLWTPCMWLRRSS